MPKKKSTTTKKKSKVTSAKDMVKKAKEPKVKVETKKIKVLAYMDSPVVQTGFGRVSREILTRLQDTGLFDIVVVGLNDRGEYHEQRNKFKIIPCPDLKDDPYGYQVFIKALKDERPDVVFAMNDIWVFTGFPENKNVDWFKEAITKVAPGTPVVCYFTIDGHPNAPEWDAFIRWLTVPVVMSDFGEKTVLETAPDIKSKIMKAYHGSGTKYFYPLSSQEKEEARKELSKGRIGPDGFIIGVVSRNQPRKNLPTLIHAFKKFNNGYYICPECGYYVSDADKYCEICLLDRKEVENGEYVEGVRDSYLYLHMAMRDVRGYKLDKIINDNRVTNILFRQDHNVAQGVSISDLNRIYNAIDVFCQPTFAEGYGLPPIEAACAGTPVIATKTTTMTEMFENGRGELVNADSVYVLADAGHCRKHHISEAGLIAAFRKLYEDKELRKEYGKKGRAFALTRTWDGAADVMGRAIIEAETFRVKVDEYFTDAQKPKFLVINTDGNPENLLSQIPLLKSLSKQNDAEVVCITDDTFSSVLEGLDFVKASFGARYAKANKQEMDRKRIQIINLSGVWDSFRQSVFPNISLSQDALYCNKYGFRSDGKYRFRPSKEEKTKAQKMLGKGKATKIFVSTSGTEENLYPFEFWAKVLEFLSKQKGKIKVFTDMVGHDPEEHESVVSVSDLSMREQLVLAKYCDIVVSCDNIFLMLGEYFDGIKIGVSSGGDIKSKYDYEDLTVISREGQEFQCWPCNRIMGVPCKKTGQKFSECAAHIRPEEIVGMILTAIKQKVGEKE